MFGWGKPKVFWVFFHICKTFLILDDTPSSPNYPHSKDFRVQFSLGIHILRSWTTAFKSPPLNRLWFRTQHEHNHAMVHCTLLFGGFPICTLHTAIVQNWTCTYPCGSFHTCGYCVICIAKREQLGDWELFLKSQPTGLGTFSCLKTKAINILNCCPTQGVQHLAYFSSQWIFFKIYVLTDKLACDW